MPAKKPKRGQRCKKHGVELVMTYSYFPKKKGHLACPKCLHELVGHKYITSVETYPIYIGPTEFPVKVELNRCHCGKLKPYDHE